jgi:hypothetical protein
MVRLMSAAAICLLLIVRMVAPAAGAAAQERVAVQVRPAFAQAPATVRIDVMVEPDEHNRALLIGLDSGEYYRSSAIALEGAGAARFYSVQYAAVPAGAYQVQVEVHTATGDARGEAHGAVTVMP